MGKVTQKSIIFRNALFNENNKSSIGSISLSVFYIVISFSVKKSHRFTRSLGGDEIINLASSEAISWTWVKTLQTNFNLNKMMHNNIRFCFFNLTMILVKAKYWPFWGRPLVLK